MVNVGAITAPKLTVPAVVPASAATAAVAPWPLSCTCTSPLLESTAVLPFPVASRHVRVDRSDSAIRYHARGDTSRINGWLGGSGGGGGVGGSVGGDSASQLIETSSMPTFA